MGVGIIACLFGVLVLMLAAVLITPKVVNTKTVKDKLRSEIKETSGVEIDFKQLVLDFFPHPHVIFNQVTLSMLPVVKGKAASVSVHPKILPLFLGRMQIAGIRLDSAELNYTLPLRSPLKNELRSHSHNMTWEKRFSPWFQRFRNSKYRIWISRLSIVG